MCVCQMELPGGLFLVHCSRRAGLPDHKATSSSDCSRREKVQPCEPILPKAGEFASGQPVVAGGVLGEA